MQERSQDTIEAVKFVPSDVQTGPRIARWQWVVGILVLLALFIFWFLFTSRSVQFNFSETPGEVTVSGGLSFELGGVYLLRQGTYRIEASAALHEPLVQDIEVGSERNQSIDFTFTPLPGFLTLTLSPQDAAVSVDGAAAEGRELELPAGQHEVLVEHPRYLPEARIVDIEGKRKTQELSVTLAPNWANVEVTSSPPGATIYVDDEPLGTTPGIVEALAGEREIRVQAEGYRAHRQRIFAQAGEPMTLDSVTLVQADAKLTLTSMPRGAGVTINGQFSGRTPLTVDLKSGVSHAIQIISNGYRTAARSRTLARGETSNLHVNLVRQTGEVVVRVEPETALLTIDGRNVGPANQTLTLPVAEHELQVSLDGYAGYSQRITPKAGLTQEVKVRLLTIAEARLQALKPNIETAAGQTLKLFEPFAFTMGASRREPGRRANETLRDVNMDRLFYIGTHEVTNAEFREFAAGHDSGSYEEVTLNEDEYPVVNLSWHDAAAYCNWLSDRDGLPPFYQMEFGKVVGQNVNATGYRLPMEAEWAWAARTVGDKPGEAQLRFPWGSNMPPPDRHGNYADRAASSLVGRIIFGYNDNQTAAAPIGTFKANVRGLYDMGGNVAEWMHDYYEIPGKETVTNPIGPARGEYHAIRGSSWMHGTITELRFSFRDYGIDARQDVGFRLARYAE